jgi:hypothetical protein
MIASRLLSLFQIVDVNNSSEILKLCPKCQMRLPIHEFPVRSIKRPRPNAYCKPCQRIYSQQHYKCHAYQHNLRRRENQRRYKVRNRKLMDEYLVGKVCIDCGESDPIVLEFDHVRGSKVDDISTLICRAFSWKRIEEEIAKCVIRCANCHRRKTAAQFWKRAANGR